MRHESGDFCRDWAANFPIFGREKIYSPTHKLLQRVEAKPGRQTYFRCI